MPAKPPPTPNRAVTLQAALSEPRAYLSAVALAKAEAKGRAATRPHNRGAAPLRPGCPNGFAVASRGSERTGPRTLTVNKRKTACDSHARARSAIRRTRPRMPHQTVVRVVNRMPLSVLFQMPGSPGTDLPEGRPPAGQTTPGQNHYSIPPGGVNWDCRPLSPISAKAGPGA